MFDFIWLSGIDIKIAAVVPSAGGLWQPYPGDPYPSLRAACGAVVQLRA
jgi:hypothetical protein